MKGLLVISALGLIAMLAEVFKFRKLLLPLVLIGVAAAYVLNILEWRSGMSISYFDNMIGFDRMAIAFSGIILVTAFLWFILANDYFHEESSQVDHFALVLFALVGALMLTAFKNMTTLFLGIEIMSIPMYVLAASRKQDLKSNEAGFKYLLMGAFASAILLFGIALIYGATGSFDLLQIRNYVASGSAEAPLFFYAGVILMLAAMCFKIAAAPFHFWAPDVYEGSPTLITALMSTVVKTAAFTAFMRLFMIVFGDISGVWTGALAVVIALSLIIANFTAAMQASVKRMLAYSSISHAAFMLMVVLANNRSNISLDAIIYYSLAYSIGSIAAFGVLYSVNRDALSRSAALSGETYEAFNGLGKRNPGLALCMTIAMLSLAGIPIAAGFFAKYFVFTVLIGTAYKWLLILGVITSAVGAYYYLKVIIAMYFKQHDLEKPVAVENSGMVVITVATILTILLGVAPGYIAEMFRF
jgi:NADH-quinone oxidoreductase subunit N